MKDTETTYRDKYGHTWNVTYQSVARLEGTVTVTYKQATIKGDQDYNFNEYQALGRNEAEAYSKVISLAQVYIDRIHTALELAKASPAYQAKMQAAATITPPAYKIESDYSTGPSLLRQPDQQPNINRTEPPANTVGDTYSTPSDYNVSSTTVTGQEQAKPAKTEEFPSWILWGSLGVVAVLVILYFVFKK